MTPESGWGGSSTVRLRPWLRLCQWQLSDPARRVRVSIQRSNCIRSKIHSFTEWCSISQMTDWLIPSKAAVYEVFRYGNLSRIVEFQWISNLNLVSLSNWIFQYIWSCLSGSNITNSKLLFTFHRGIFVLWIWGLMDQFLKDHQLNKAEFGVTDESISVWISGSQDKNPSSNYQ